MLTMLFDIYIWVLLVLGSFKAGQLLGQAYIELYEWFNNK